MSAALTTRIPIRDRRGNIIDEKEVATYAGLLAQAHEEGLRGIETKLVQVPSEENGHLAIVTARVETERGVFVGIGDAGPQNVNRRIAPHSIRMAETRAKARALRDAVNIGVVAMEELGGDNDFNGSDDHGPGDNYNQRDGGSDERRYDNVQPLHPRNRNGKSPSGRQRPSPRNGQMTPAQRRLLYRLLSEAGYEAEDATAMLCKNAGVATINEVTKSRASELIDAWKREVAGA